MRMALLFKQKTRTDKRRKIDKTEIDKRRFIKNQTDNKPELDYYSESVSEFQQI